MQTAMGNRDGGSVDGSDVGGLGVATPRQQDPVVALAIERTSASCAVETQHLMLHAMGLVAFDCALNGLGPIEVEELFLRLACEVARKCSRPAHQAAKLRLRDLRAEGVLS